MSTKILGNFGENYAEKLLLVSGYKILDKNFRCKIGEIDIIALKDGVLVFVEVKTRNSLKFGLPEEAVNKNKLDTIRRVGEWYVKNRQDLPLQKRIDVVSLLLSAGRVISGKIIRAI